ncbi:MAG: hypothetical protein WC852_00070 [Candidatus Nanoarchaeia archaeon]|jgi:hypothetical protein
MEYVFALKPEPCLYNKIRILKTSLKKQMGNQLYINDEPHVTLCVLDLGDDISFKDKLDFIIGSFRSKFKKIRFSINAWSIFSEDPVTSCSTLVCRLNMPGNVLNNLQSKLLKELQLFRTKDIALRYIKVKFKNKEFNNCLQQYGYPFMGMIWIPHISIGSFDKKAINKAIEKTENKCPIGLYSFQSLIVYKLLPSDKLVPLYKYPF